MFSEVLSVEQVGIKDNFFDLGGHSLLAVRFVTKVKELRHIDLPLRSIFTNPTVEGLALEIGDSSVADSEALADTLDNIFDELCLAEESEA